MFEIKQFPNQTIQRFQVFKNSNVGSLNLEHPVKFFPAYEVAVKFQNTGAKPCTISIRKIWDPLQIESILDDDEENKENVPPKSSSSNMVEDILDECLKNVDNNFEFTDGYFTLAEFDSKLVKVVLKNTSYVGDYLEKFRVEVLEKDQNGILQSNGCQVILLIENLFITIST